MCSTIKLNSICIWKCWDVWGRCDSKYSTISPLLTRLAWVFRIGAKNWRRAHCHGLGSGLVYRKLVLADHPLANAGRFWRLFKFRAQNMYPELSPTLDPALNEVKLLYIIVMWLHRSGTRFKPCKKWRPRAGGTPHIPTQTCSGTLPPTSSPGAAAIRRMFSAGIR